MAVSKNYTDKKLQKLQQKITYFLECGAIEI